MKDLQFLQIILGDIAANENYGLVMKKWRELFNITQARIAKELNIKQSVISDYENNRRKSPGIEFIRKYTSSLIHIAKNEQSRHFEVLKKNIGIEEDSEKLFKGDFSKELTTKQVINLLKAVQIIAPVEQSEFHDYVFFTDNISKIVTKQPSFKLLKDLKSDKHTVFIFSKVKTGKIPLIMLKILSKVSRIELPKLLIFQSEKFKLSPIARRLSKNSNISIAVTKEDNNSIRELLNIDKSKAVDE